MLVSIGKKMPYGERVEGRISEENLEDGASLLKRLTGREFQAGARAD